MSRRQRYRTNAEECLRLARNVSSTELRAIFTTMAHGWYRLSRVHVEDERASEEDRYRPAFGQTSNVPSASKAPSVDAFGNSGRAANCQKVP
jgi:hypothetical protein